MKFQTLFTCISYITFLLYISLLASIFHYLKIDYVIQTLQAPRTLHSIYLSLTSAFIATFLSISLGIPTAYILSRKNFSLKKAIDLILEFPVFVSPAALGALVLIFFNTTLGFYIRDNFFDPLYSFKGIILAQFISTLGIAIRLIKAVFDEIPIRYENIARTLGANEFQAFLEITLPLSKNGIISTFLVVWGKAIGEFGATITIAGLSPYSTETLPLAIFMKLSTADLQGCLVLIIILVSISFLVLTLTRFIANLSNFL